MIRVLSRGVLPPAALAACTLAITACGSGSSSVSAAAYVRSVCTAATSWKDAIQAAGSRLQTNDTRSLARTKSSYLAFVNALVSATGRAESALVAAGSPSVPDGRRIASTLVRIFAQAKAGLVRAAHDAARLPTGSERSFANAATRVENEIRGSLTQMSQATPEKNPQLHAAAAGDRTCRSLASSTSG